MKPESIDNYRKAERRTRIVTPKTYDYTLGLPTTLLCSLKELVEEYAIVQSSKRNTKTARLDVSPFVLPFRQEYTTEPDPQYRICFGNNTLRG
jgi:hypothetical protein